VSARHRETILKKTAKTALKRTGDASRPKKQPAAAERPGAWHLARTETERRLSDFEFRLERLAQAYYRWKAACLSAVCDVPLTGDDVAVLNVVRMGDEPKRLSEIGQLLNRVDVPNLQYATRKLVRAGLIETEGSSSRKETRYRATATGHSVTEAYAALRGATLPPMLEAVDGWAAKSETASLHLDLISSLYAQAAQVAITRRHQPES
jgi:predicted MarR family transcription regulator